MRIGVLNNLRAGRSRAQVSKILAQLRRYPEVAHVETDSARALPEALAELARREVDVLVLQGGDGTLQYTLTELLTSSDFERLPAVAPLRGGRTNMTALDLGASRDPVKGLTKVLEAARNGTLAERIVERPVLRVSSSRRQELHYGMFFGAGMIHRAIALTHRLFPPGRSQGVLGAGLVTASLVWKVATAPKEGVLAPDKLQILLDGELVPHGEFYMVIATSLRRLFLGMNPFWGDGAGPVRLTCISSDAERVRSATLPILRGRPTPLLVPENGYTSRNVDSSDLRMDCGYTVDGEIFAPQPDEVVTLAADRRIRFVRA